MDSPSAYTAKFISDLEKQSLHRFFFFFFGWGELVSELLLGGLGICFGNE